MWIILFSLTLSAAVCFGVAAIALEDRWRSYTTL